jgi:hypothetical protein
MLRGGIMWAVVGCFRLINVRYWYTSLDHFRQASPSVLKSEPQSLYPPTLPNALRPRQISGCNLCIGLILTTD